MIGIEKKEGHEEKKGQTANQGPAGKGHEKEPRRVKIIGN